MSGSDRGQAYTLEGVIAAIILASALLYGLQAVDVAPYTDDTRSDRRLDSLRTQTADALSVAAENGTLRRAVTCINGTTGEVHGQVGQPPNAVTGGNVAGLGAILNSTLGDGNRQYMVLFDYRSGSNSDFEIVHPNVSNPRVNFTREPVTVTRRVTIYNTTPVLEPVSGAGCQPTGRTFKQRADDAGAALWLPRSVPGAPDSQLYAVVTVRVIAW